jgi:hypothetical protein
LVRSSDRFGFRHKYLNNRLLAEVRQEARGTHAKGIEIYILTIKNDYFVIFARGLIERVRQRFVEEGIDAALSYRQGRGRKQRRLDGEQEAYLLAIACSEAPQGRERCTLRMLADKMVELNHVESLSHETVRQTLKKMKSNLGKKMAG